ncbi:MAG: M23 family metallopeptidase [Bdellovibrionota bacterium]
MNRLLKRVCLLLCLGACVSGPSVKEYQESMPNPNASLLDFAVPIEDVSPKVISLFGWRSARRMHEGIDFRASKGTPVLATEKGVVLYSGQSLKGFGIIVVIGHGDDWSSIYAHLSKSLVQRGDNVRKGQKIAFSGNTGRSSGPHLHFEIRKGADPLDPLLFLKRGTFRLP